MDRKHFLMATLMSVILLTLVVAPMSTQEDVKDYDPWCDINDDGKIDIKDIATVAIKYGTTGTPINKTALLYKVNATFTELLTRINSLNASLVELQSKTKDSLGDWASKNAGTVYQANTAGFVVCVIKNADGSQAQAIGYTDANNPPTTVRANIGSHQSWGPGAHIYFSFTIPLRKTIIGKLT